MRVKHIIGRVYCAFNGHESPQLVEHLRDIARDKCEHFPPIPMESRRIYCRRCNRTSFVFKTGVTVQAAWRIVDNEIVILDGLNERNGESGP